jgi:pyruvate dehydrogenase E2 component (dihydrolipoamide acetyltransferase)
MMSQLLSCERWPEQAQGTMIRDVVMPSLGLTMEEGTIVEWYCSVGDVVELGADFFLLETEKSEVEIDAPYRGILTEILVGPGETVDVGVPIARMLVEDDSAGATDAERAIPPTADVAVDSTAPPIPPEVPSTESTEVAVPAGSIPKVRATPLARRLAADRGIELARVSGTGPNGRIVRRDIEALEHTASSVSASAKVEARRAIIAERMHASSITAAPVTLTTRARADDLVRFRARLLQDPPQGVDAGPSYNDIIVAACAAAIIDHRDITLQLDQGVLRRPGSINIGLAVQSPTGLVVPVIKKADTMSIFEIARESTRLIEAVMRNRVAPSDLEEGTFTVTNLGAEGVDIFTPVINLPESAILGVGAIRDSVEVVDGAPAVRSMISLSLTFDHRTIDGQPAARFLGRVVELLEYPYDLPVS